MTKRLGFCILAFAVAACSRAGGPNAMPAAPAANALPIAPNAAGYPTVFAFDGTDGSEPEAPLLVRKNLLYGTTWYGGKSNCGVLFTLTSAGKQSVVYSFGSSGCNALGLTGTKKAIYGITHGGGAYDKGAVFSDSSTGHQSWSYSFKGGSDGENPEGAVTYLKNVVYGTTAYGGSACGGDGCGTIYKVAKGGKESVIYSFKGEKSSQTDGEMPTAGLLYFDGTFYGTASYGGAHSGGAVYTVSPSGVEKVIYSFESVKYDAQRPEASLIAVNGALYGTTVYGGTYGLGTVFSITPSGVEHVIHSFGSGSDGEEPAAKLLNVKGKLYGTTTAGGGSTNCTDGCGTVFEMSTSGAETVLHDFAGGSDGATPEAGLTALKGKLYGTTNAGGKSNDGTIFALTP